MGRSRSGLWLLLRVASTFHLRPDEVEALPPGEYAHLAAYCRLELEEST